MVVFSPLGAGQGGVSDQNCGASDALLGSGTVVASAEKRFDRLANGRRNFEFFLSLAVWNLVLRVASLERREE